MLLVEGFFGNVDFSLVVETNEERRKDRIVADYGMLEKENQKNKPENQWQKPIAKTQTQKESYTYFTFQYLHFPADLYETLTTVLKVLLLPLFVT